MHNIWKGYNSRRSHWNPLMSAKRRKIDDRTIDEKHPLAQISADAFKCRHRILRWAGNSFRGVRCPHPYTAGIGSSTLLMTSKRIKRSKRDKNIQLVGSEFGVNNMKAWIHPILYQRFVAGGVRGEYFLRTLCPLSNNWASFKLCNLREYCCCPCPLLYNHSVHVFWWQENTLCHKTQILKRVSGHDNVFTILQQPPQSPDLNPTGKLWDVVEREIHIIDMQPTELQQLCDAMMSI